MHLLVTVQQGMHVALRGRVNLCRNIRQPLMWTQGVCKTYAIACFCVVLPLKAAERTQCSSVPTGIPLALQKHLEAVTIETHCHLTSTEQPLLPSQGTRHT